MGRVFEFALTLFVVDLVTSVFACLVASEISSCIAELFSTLLDVLPK